MDTTDARRALDELAYARDKKLLAPVEVHRRTTAILDRTNLKPLDLAEFLRQKGHSEFELFRLVGPFGVAVKRAYVAEHGHEPLQRLGDTPGQARPVYAYVDDDLPLIEAAYVALVEDSEAALPVGGSR